MHVPLRHAFILPQQSIMIEQPHLPLPEPGDVHRPGGSPRARSP
jgi:hypothetical protein